MGLLFIDEYDTIKRKRMLFLTSLITIFISIYYLTINFFVIPLAVLIKYTPSENDFVSTDEAF